MSPARPLVGQRSMGSRSSHKGTKAPRVRVDRQARLHLCAFVPLCETFRRSLPPQDMARRYKARSSGHPRTQGVALGWLGSGLWPGSMITPQPSPSGAPGIPNPVARHAARALSCQRACRRPSSTKPSPPQPARTSRNGPQAASRTPTGRAATRHWRGRWRRGVRRWSCSR